MFASFNRFEIKMTLEQARSASHQGECADDVSLLLTLNSIKRQLAAIPDDALREELKGYGAWDDEELADRSANERRIIWIAAGNIVEENNL